MIDQHVARASKADEWIVVTAQAILVGAVGVGVLEPQLQELGIQSGIECTRAGGRRAKIEIAEKRQTPSAVQELIIRGAIQSSLEMCFTDPDRVTRAIVVSGLLFAVTHIHMSFLFAVLAFMPGVFWGWLFARKRNLSGVIFSHVVVGAYVFFILGVSVQ